ncbi:MAG: adenosylcobinamide-GDP ribazoletransferase [Desulfatitalea sp.]|nr:adenosylcobinamide-GDP ribazoletransferase [Desulfatitalea sp.]
MWNDIRSAIQFLTILPVGQIRHFDPRGTLVQFPLGGLLIGILLVIVDSVAGSIWDPAATAVIDVVTLALITGALHLDGLADTADGLYGRRPPEKALAIMKDSRIGAIGMVAVVCCLGIKWAGLAGIAHQRAVWLLLIPAFARTTVLFGTRILPYGRPGGGTGHPFFQNPLRIRDFWGVAALLALTTMISGWGVLWIVIGSAGLMVGVLTYYRVKINCITGDMLGAMIEVTETGLFLLIAASMGPA